MRKTYAMLAAAATVAACTDFWAPELPVPMRIRSAVQSTTAVSRLVVTLNDEFSAVTESTFAAVFRDSTGAPVVLLTDVNKLTAARATGVDSILLRRRIPTGNIKVQQALYSFRQLRRWYDSVWNAAWAVPGLVLTEIDAAHNRLLYGIKTTAGKDSLATLLARYGVPAGAVSIEIRGPFGNPATLGDLTRKTARISANTNVDTDYVRPLRGGLAFRWDTSGARCTLM